MERLRVLVLDDEPIVGRRLKPALERIGCEVEVFTEPGEALARLDQVPFHVVLTDMVMDEVDGMGVLEHVAKLSPETLVIVITGYAMMEMAREAMGRGAFDFLTKPFDLDVIRDAVRRAATALGIELAGSKPSPGT